jgi:hypothetical protein
MFDLTKCYCSTGLIFNFYSNRLNVRKQTNIFFLTVIMSITHPVTNDTNDQELIEFPFGTAGQFRLGIRSVTEGAMFTYVSLSNVHDVYVQREMAF